jgi:hypothetical protein
LLRQSTALPTWPLERWEREDDERRAACALVASVVLLAALRLWMALTQRPAFLDAYGQAHQLDTRTPSGRVIADLHAPNLVGATLFDLTVLVLMVPCVGLVVRGLLVEGHYLAIGLGALGAAGVLSSLAYPVPWWFLVSTLLLLAEVVTAVLVLVRAGRWTRGVT